MFLDGSGPPAGQAMCRLDAAPYADVLSEALQQFRRVNVSPQEVAR
jgi:hypothetical protein